MKQPLGIVGLLITLGACAPVRTPDPAATTTPLTIGETFTIVSKVLGETRRINVYAPPGYVQATTDSLPVLYMPDGGMAEDFLHIAGLVQVSVGNGTMRPFLLVGIENTERRRDMTGPTTSDEDRRIAPRVGGSEAFRAFIRTELMPAVKARYRTTGERAIVGESLAGLFVVETLFLEPDLFDTYIAFDPSLWWNSESLVGTAAERLRERPMGGKTLYFAGSAEPGIVGPAQRLAALLERNPPAGFTWHFERMPEEQHSTIYHPAALRAFRALFAPRSTVIASTPSPTVAPAPATRPDSFARAPRRGYVPKTSHADSLRGAIASSGRRWWDVTFYDLHVTITPKDSSIAGYNAISYRVLEPATEMQIDLMEPLLVDSMIDQDRRTVRFRREGDAFFATLPSAQRAGQRRMITVYYHGRPRIAKNPPWEGGFTWTTDSLGRAWIVTTDQGMGASVWWPNKDTQADEPDSQRVALRVPDPMVNVSNGRLRSTVHHPDGTTTWEWFVVNPINNYAIAVAAGSYAHWSESYAGLNGALTMDFWPLDYNLETARRQWVQARSMMQCFEHWFGPYPWYEDGYKLLEVPNTGMEHQSAVSYGNYYENGYRRRESSGTGLGLQWDFIIVHESAHEWWGNSITAKDNADMWVHESFANYAEGIYTECLLGKDAASRYIVGNRRGIRNDRPIIPGYGVNDQGSGDMYPKGGEMLHTIRQIVGDDEKWRGILTGLQRTFRHRTVMGSQIESYISERAGTNLSRVFDQYLRTTMIPTFEYAISGDTLAYRWATVVPGFDMPVEVTLADSGYSVLRPTEAWQRVPLRLARPSEFRVKPDYYVIPKQAGSGGSP